MKSFKQFLSESVNIAGDFNGNLYIGGSEPEVTKESFVADVVWEGKIYRMEVEGSMMSKTQLAEELQVSIQVQSFITSIHQQIKYPELKTYKDINQKN
jgi:fibrillarin-like rRNA methylase